MSTSRGKSRRNGSRTAEGGPRRPIVNGLFYPSEPERLRGRITELVGPAREARAWAVVTPHAALDYAGVPLGRAYSAAAGLRSIRTVLVAAPLHRDPGEAVLLPESTAFATPLGTVEVDIPVMDGLTAEDRRIERDETPFLEEHSIEVQLPFIQVLFPQARIVPLLLGRLTAPRMRELAAAVRSVLSVGSDEVLCVATSNMSSGDEAALWLELLLAGDTRAMLQRMHRRELRACGGLCIALVSSLLREAGPDTSPVELMARSEPAASAGVRGRSAPGPTYAAFALFRNERG